MGSFKEKKMTEKNLKIDMKTTYFFYIQNIPKKIEFGKQRSQIVYMQTEKLIETQPIFQFNVNKCDEFNKDLGNLQADRQSE